jgi:4-hydroxy-tetrahydrodipicolinate reductase
MASSGVPYNGGVRVLQVGLGAIGCGIARRVRQRFGLDLVGAVDVRPDLAGRDLGELIGAGRLDLPVLDSLEAAIDRTAPDLVMNATGSRLPAIVDQLRAPLEAGIAVVSTCEELSYPYHRYPALAAELDALARERRAVLLGTGINPGFVMDKLVVTLLAACASVRAVRVGRIVDAGTRRESFQRKIGAGMAPSDFERQREELGHVGLPESAHMLADVIGVGPARTLRDELRPVRAERRLTSRYLEIEVGQVAGIDQTVTITEGSVERVRMELKMYVGADRPRDEVSVDGSPPLEMVIPSGVPGDEGTAAVAVSCAQLVPELPFGLCTMLDVPLRPGRIRS